MTPDHEAAKCRADGILAAGPGGSVWEDDNNLARAYLDLLAQRDEALALLEDAERIYIDSGSDLGNAIRAFLAKHRKTGANDGN